MDDARDNRGEILTPEEVELLYPGAWRTLQEWFHLLPDSDERRDEFDWWRDDPTLETFRFLIDEEGDLLFEHYIQQPMMTSFWDTMLYWSNGTWKRV